MLLPSLGVWIIVGIMVYSALYILEFKQNMYYLSRANAFPTKNETILILAMAALWPVSLTMLIGIVFFAWLTDRLGV